jgi:hypothetical protein
MKRSEAIIPSQAGWNKGDSQKLMTGFGTARDVKGKHLKRIWELEYPVCDLLIYKRSLLLILEIYPSHFRRRPRFPWTDFKKILQSHGTPYRASYSPKKRQYYKNMNFYLSQLQEQIHNEYSAAFSEIN